MRNERATASLRGLATGDGFGSCFTDPLGSAALATRTPPPGPWLWTDDTEMACSVYRILLRHGRIEQDALALSFAEHYDIYRRYGPGTTRILRLMRRDGTDWRELAPRARGGAGSWGNGAAMRVAPLGAYFADVPDRVPAQAVAAAEVTHTHPEGIEGAVAVAVAAALVAAEPGLRGPALLSAIADRTPSGAVRDRILAAREISETGSAAAELGTGQECRALDTVPYCLWLAARYRNRLTEAWWTAAAAGGDVDTTCAIVGGVLAADPGLPAEWSARTEPLPAWALP
ncbi:ADP-ribosylglycohydrolase family protein [Nocardia jiangsuensis]|uniref:ADP-ribosylglycohydrolase family protein n=1 Tax=Nocardia jiangsuensis TaxID=1691563 RepID=A0ABV8DRT2_9NOCA